MSIRRLDHLVMPFQDLAAAVELFTQLGFRVGTRNRHPWGTENHIVQFPGTFLELITVGEGATVPAHAPRNFSFGQHVAGWLKRQQEPMSMVVLSSADAAADAKHFAQSNIGDFEPFYFRREGKRPDGSTVEVAFTLAFATSAAMPDHSFFVCQQHFPQNFWNAAAQQHDNGVVALDRIVIRHNDPQVMVPFLEAFTGVKARQDKGNVTMPLQDGDIHMVPVADADRAADVRPRVEVIRFRVSSLADVQSRAAQAGLKSSVKEARDGSVLLVSAPQLGSMMLAFKTGAV